MKKEIKGLGDLVEAVTEVTGIKTVVDTISEVTGTPCGCERRQEILNKLVPFKNETSNQFQDVDNFKEGKYLVLNNFVFTFDKKSYCYQKNDKIYIKEEDPTFNTLKTFFQLGIIVKLNGSEIVSN